MSKRVLLIDDEEHIRRMMRITFEAAGYTVGEARAGPEGLKLYGDGSTWDAVVLDQRMPTSEQAAPPTQEPSSLPVIETITMNGFSVLDPDKEDWQLADQRRFTVVSPAGTRHEVLVQIDEEVVGYVERLTRRRLPPENSFWTAQARRLLSDYLWNKGDIPQTRKLTITQIGRDELLVAERWMED